MADEPQVQQLSGPPPGVSFDSTPHDAAPKPLTAPPPGVVFDAQPHDASPRNWTPDQLEAEKAKSRDPNVNYTPVSEMTGETGMSGVMTGLGKESASLLTGAATLAAKGANKLLPSSTQIPLPTPIPKPKGIAENVGGMVGQGLEFAAGEEGLKALTSVAKVAHYAPELIQLLEDYPTASKIILGALKAGTVGGAQGALESAGTGESAVKGAEGGALGGAIGGAAGETVGAVAPRVLRALGLGGQTFESAMARAGRPAIPDRDWKASLETLKPVILEKVDRSKIRTIDDFVASMKGIRQGIWKQVTDQMGKVGQAVFSAQSIGDEIEKAITPELEYWEPTEAADMKSFAKKFHKNMTIQEAHNTLEFFNAKLKRFYNAAPQDDAAVTKIDGSIASLEKASDALRKKMFDEIEARGQKSPELLRRQYGASADIERIFAKRIPVADRQQPMNLAQIISLAGGAGEAATALLTGHPLAAIAGAVPPVVATAVKLRQLPESLIRQGLRAGAREGVESTAGKIAKTAAGAAGAQAGQWIRFKGGDGQDYEHHPDESFDEIQQRDPAAYYPTGVSEGTPTEAQ